MCGLLQEVPPVDLSAAKATPPVRSVSADLKFLSLDVRRELRDFPKHKPLATSVFF